MGGGGGSRRSNLEFKGEYLCSRESTCHAAGGPAPALYDLGHVILAALGPLSSSVLEFSAGLDCGFWSPGCGQGLFGRAYHLHHTGVLHCSHCHPLWLPSHSRPSSRGECLTPRPAPRPSPAKSAPLIHPGTQRRFRGKVFLVGGHGGAPASRDLLLFAPGRGALEGGLWGRGRSLSGMIGTLQKFTGQEKWASGRAARLGWAWTAVFPKLEDSVDREGMEEGPP